MDNTIVCCDRSQWLYVTVVNKLQGKCVECILKETLLSGLNKHTVLILQAEAVTDACTGPWGPCVYSRSPHSPTLHARATYTLRCLKNTSGKEINLFLMLVYTDIIIINININ